MIDLHCHILPSIDDGAEAIEDSIAMAKAACKEGIHTIVATPHHQNGVYINPAEGILRQVKQLNDRLKEEGINLTILPGQEIRLYGELLEDYELGEIVTLNRTDKYILIEFPANHVPRYAEKMLYELRIKGITPIIVHPERNTEIIERPGVLYKFVNQGALTQITAGSIAGKFGKKIKKFSLQLIEHHLAHVISSDAHNTTTRSFHLQAAYEVIEKSFGSSTLYYFKENTYSLISGEIIYREEPEQVRRKKILGLF
ncbi:phosphotyrosine-protein phosphatase (capsular polysaccharide biosynthesis) [Bacillus cereus VDM021]|uniref:tyrosine-protein phosphatase n=1 Tax=Bacillus cereus group TaxID=86661 RepID=UPI00032E56A0|nr:MULTISPECIES: CpsB/CapC family capsule biosynthesis tyrosine phosphatase [Bacillus cereus group]EOQ19492.1 phosphotyrosine-protein phosphatase (capsular polysaccharide biosynthesis) [Bacillus cereus VDM021]MDF2083378.1 tyrosine protein phosphatase [Bacillus pseudomycoides]